MLTALKGQRNIHPIDRCHDCWNMKDNGQGGQDFDGLVYFVRENDLVGIAKGPDAFDID